MLPALPACHLGGRNVSYLNVPNNAILAIFSPCFWACLLPPLCVVSACLLPGCQTACLCLLGFETYSPASLAAEHHRFISVSSAACCCRLLEPWVPHRVPRLLLRIATVSVQNNNDADEQVPTSFTTCSTAANSVTCYRRRFLYRSVLRLPACHCQRRRLPNTQREQISMIISVRHMPPSRIPRTVTCRTTALPAVCVPKTPPQN